MGFVLRARLHGALVRRSPSCRRGNGIYNFTWITGRFLEGLFAQRTFGREIIL